MPNWVANSIRIEGKGRDKLLEQVLVKNEHGKWQFDFNKILPMPPELDIESGSSTDEGIELYLTSINPAVYHYGDEKMDTKELIKLVKKLNDACGYGIYDTAISKSMIAELSKDKAVLDNQLAVGKQAVDNLQKYGAKDWYDWRNANWGTKWNACETEYFADSGEICFDTAWSDVHELMQKLSEKYPDTTVFYDFAEEQTGYYAGSYELKNGKVISGGTFDQYSKEAYAKYYELWGGSDGDYGIGKSNDQSEM